MFDMLSNTFIDNKVTWSKDTFGPGRRTEGICKHIEKELAEIRKDPGDLTEWVDVILLALDGASRLGYSGVEIIDAIYRKQSVNYGREWPAPRGEDEAIEHVRSVDEVSDPQP